MRVCVAVVSVRVDVLDGMYEYGVFDVLSWERAWEVDCIVFASKRTARTS